MIRNIKLENFKFHKELKFNISKTNCLIYGENGSGKSSIYWGLYSIFKKNSMEKDIEEYKTHGSNSSPNVEITLDDSTILNNNTTSELINNNSNTIYFTNQDFLELIINQDNFYDIIENSLIKFFSTSLSSYIKEFNRINNDIDENNIEDETKKRLDNIKKFEILLEKLESKANDIINNHFDEEFLLSFKMEWGTSQLASGSYQFNRPKISIEIDNKKSLKLNFNEAKLKLTSMAIFFGLIKIEEDKTNSLKLLVLDDFLTSLDMANRKLIIQYILDNFSDYQIIIFTHNIQFFNLIIGLLKMRDEDKNWDIKNIFFRRKDNNYETIIYDKETDYIKIADEYINSNLLDEAGIYLRKEFERILDELRQKNEIGAKEKLGNILNQLLELNDSKDVNITKMQTILKKTKFYRDNVLHSTAHDDRDTQIYIKELNGAKVLLEQLRKQLKVLKI